MKKKCGKVEIRTQDFCMKDGRFTNCATINITTTNYKKALFNVQRALWNHVQSHVCSERYASGHEKGPWLNAWRYSM